MNDVFREAKRLANAQARRPRRSPPPLEFLTAWSSPAYRGSMTRRLTQRGRERRQQLMDYAAARFAEKGYHPTSVAEIVQGLGVGKGVFYWYFDSKEQLFIEILRDAQHSLRRAQQQAIAGEDDPVRRIALGIRASMRWSAEHSDVNKLIQFAATEERFLPALRKGQEVAVSDAVRHIKEGIARGQVRDSDPTILAHAVLGVSTHLARVCIHEKHEPPDDVADAAVSFVLEGMLVPDAITATG
jgi:AcrR family transcriptional regulator